MEYEEFNKLSGHKADYKIFEAEIEPTYMLFEAFTKREIVAMYWGMKKGAYAMWQEANAMMREGKLLKECLDKMEKQGLTVQAKIYRNEFNARINKLTQEVQKMELDSLPEFRELA